MLFFSFFLTAERLCNIFVCSGGGRQTELHERAVRGVNRTMEKVNSFVDSVHQRLRGFVPDSETTNLAERETHT